MDILNVYQPQTGDHKKDIPDHGTQITFFWSRAQKPIPKFDDLCEKLRTWFELKNILRKNAPMKVLLVYHDERGRERTKDDFLHKFWGYEKTPIPGIDDLKNEKVPGEEFTISEAKIYTVPEGTKLSRSSSREERTGGLFIEDENENLYDLQLFGLEYSQYTRLLIGTIQLTKNFRDIVKKHPV